MSGREYLRRGDGGDKPEIEGKLTCSCLSFWVLHSYSGAGRFRVRGGGGGGGAGAGGEGGLALLIKAPRLLLLSTPLLPLSASTFPILKPRGKAKPAVNLNRYNSCRPKQCTEGNGSERQRAAKVGTDRNNAPGRGRGRVGEREVGREGGTL